MDSFRIARLLCEVGREAGALFRAAIFRQSGRCQSQCGARARGETRRRDGSWVPDILPHLEIVRPETRLRGRASAPRAACGARDGLAHCADVHGHIRRSRSHRAAHGSDDAPAEEHEVAHHGPQLEDRHRKSFRRYAGARTEIAGGGRRQGLRRRVPGFRQSSVDPGRSSSHAGNTFSIRAHHALPGYGGVARSRRRGGFVGAHGRGQRWHQRIYRETPQPASRPDGYIGNHRDQSARVPFSRPEILGALSQSTGLGICALPQISRTGPSTRPSPPLKGEAALARERGDLEASLTYTKNLLNI